MTAIYEWLAAASAWWWPRFADHLWQTTVFALVILIASFVLGVRPEHGRSLGLIDAKVDPLDERSLERILGHLHDRL